MAASDDSPAPNLRARRWRRIIIGILALILLAAAALRWALPPLIAGQIREAVAGLGLTRYDFRIAQIGLRQTSVHDIDLAYPGWNGQIEEVRFAYRPMELLRGKLDRVTIQEAALEIDLEELRAQSPEEGPSREDSTKTTDEEWTLARIQNLVPIRKLVLPETTIRVSNGPQEIAFRLAADLDLTRGGSLSLHGAEDLSLILDAELGISPKEEEEEEELLLKLHAQSNDLEPLFETLFPGWRKELPIAVTPRALDLQSDLAYSIQLDLPIIQSLRGTASVEDIRAGPWSMNVLEVSVRQEPGTIFLNSKPWQIQHDEEAAEISGAFAITLEDWKRPTLVLEELRGKLDLDRFSPANTKPSPSEEVPAPSSPSTSLSPTTEPEGFQLSSLPFGSIRIPESQWEIHRSGTQRKIALELEGDPAQGLQVNMAHEDSTVNLVIQDGVRTEIRIKADAELKQPLGWLPFLTTEAHTPLPLGAQLDVPEVWVSAEAAINTRSGAFQLTSLDTRIPQTDLAWNQFAASITDLGIQKAADEEGYHLETDGLRASWNEDAWLWEGGADLTFADDVIGSVHADSLRLYQVDHQPISVEVDGSLRDLEFRSESGLIHQGSGLAMQDLMARIEVPGQGFVPSIRLGGQVRVPMGEDWSGPAEFHIDAFWAGMGGPESLDIEIFTGNTESDQLQLSKGTTTLQAVGHLHVMGDPFYQPLTLEPVLTVQRLDYSIGETSIAAIRDLRLEGTYADPLLEMTGEGMLNGQPFPMTIRQEESPGQAEGVARVGPVRVEELSTLSVFSEGLKGVSASSTITAEILTLLKDGLQLGLRTDITDTDISYSESFVKLEGLSGNALLSHLLPTRFGAPITLAIDQVEAAKGIQFSDARITLLPDPTTGNVEVRSLMANTLGGSISIREPFIIRDGGRNFQVSLVLDSLETSQLLELVPQFEGSIQATIDGVTPILVEDGRLSFLQGNLKLSDQERAILRYDAEGLLTTTMKEGSASQKAYGWAEKALGNLNVKTLNVDLFDPEDPTHPVRIKLVGEPIDPDNPLPEVTLNIPVEDEFEQLKEGVRFFLRRLLAIELR